ncbi:hypothetical protein RB599_010043 [Gaeumannomyces hyphopodioides]
MATHDAAAGTGGLDASINYESTRDENEGAAFDHTLGQLSEFVNPDVSVADLIAIGGVASVASCGGPWIPFRPGRVDAAGAGPLGVPKHTDPIDKMVAAFDRMGFTRAEMIGLVACGHSIGQVHSVDFPPLVEGAPSAANVAPFDRSPAQFDTAVVNEYLNSDGVNPLVFGKNETTNSDKRVFGADGNNATMRALADPTNFSSTCASLLGRMIDTVPKSVTLAEPIELQDVKPYIDKLQLDAGSQTVAFQGRVRVRTTGRDAEALSVTLDVADRNGKRSDLAATRARLRGGQSQSIFQETFTWFEFSTALDADAGVSSFNIKVTDSTDNSTKVFDNNGNPGGYPAQSDLLYLQADSCLDTRIVDGNMTVRVTAAVRDGSPAPVVNFAHRVQQPNVTLTRLSVEDMQMKPLGTTRGPYSLYSAEVPLEPKGWSTTFRFSLPKAGGNIVSALYKTNALSQNC